MATFQDNTGRAWVLSIDQSAIRRARDLIGADLAALLADGFRPLAVLIENGAALADLLYVLCKPQADSRGVSDEDFGAALVGAAIYRGLEALLAELPAVASNRTQRQGLDQCLKSVRRLREVFARELTKTKRPSGTVT
jgi:hypothetical protein